MILDTPAERQMYALAAVFLAAQQANQIARHGTWQADAVRTLLAGALNQSPSSYADVFPDHRPLEGALVFLRDMLARGRQDEDLRWVMQYGLSLLHLADRLRRDRSLQEVLGQSLQEPSRRLQEAEFSVDGALLSRLADTWLKTLGTFQFRIKVHGEPMYLQNTQNAERIRSLFLAGVRAAVLWHQAGGRKWHWLVRRKQLIRTTETLLNQIAAEPS